MNPNSLCVSGVVEQIQVKCNEKPFFINQDGNISYRSHENVILNVFGRSLTFAPDICRALNLAYELGYEMDRVTWQ